MTELVSTQRSLQRSNMVCAWAGALIALAFALRLRDFPPSPTVHSSFFAGTLAITIAVLTCLHYLKGPRWAVTALCFVLGVLCTGVTVYLVSWSSSLW